MHHGDVEQPGGHLPVELLGCSDPDYTLTYVNGVVVVGTSNLVISASSGTMTYGGCVPSVTPSYSGFVNGDGPSSLSTQPTCATTATSSSAVGNYASSCSGASDPNYHITYVTGSVHVKPAPLTVTASSAMVTYGGATPTIHPTVTGLVNGDTTSSLGAGLACSTTVGPSSPVGSYASNCSGAADQLHDHLCVRDGEGHAGHTDRHGQQPDDDVRRTVPTLTATITGFVNGQTLATSGVTGSPACTTTAHQPARPAPTRSRARGTLTSTNYTFAFVAGTLTITSTTTLVCNTIGYVTVAPDSR